MNMGIWYEAIMRWLGDMTDVFAVGQTVVGHRTDKNNNRVPMSIPDHIDIIGKFAQGGQMRLNISNVIGLSPTEVDLFIFGTEGTLRILQHKGSELELFGGKGEGSNLKIMDIEPKKKGSWRVETEFINSIRGEEEVTHTDFATGVRYMEWTDAITRSLQEGKSIKLPLSS